MFKVPTTIVLGAGASCSYGYPSGHKLVDDIIGLLKGSTQQSATYERLALPRFLEFYDPPSIDAFLYHYEHNPGLLHAAKKSIAEVILKCATRDFFNRGFSLPAESLPNGDLRKADPHNWYRFLWNAIVSELSADNLAAPDNCDTTENPFGDPDDPLNFRIVTFNYDASLEYYFYSRVNSELSLFSDSQRAGFLEKIGRRISHVYGCVMNYKWRGGEDPDDYYSPTSFYMPTLIERAVERIQLMDSRSKTQYAAIQDIIRKSDQVIFLGFGFDDTNIGEKVLKLESTLAPRPIDHHSSKLPLVKYTNLGDSELINKKLRACMEPNFEGRTYLRMEDYLIKSTKTVYRAVSEDFSLNSKN